MAVRNVTKCICHGKTFNEIKEHAREHDISTLEELQKERFCSCSCGLCGPYIEMVLETGETEFSPGAYYRKNRKGSKNNR